jgi:hypothetical protein
VAGREVNYLDQIARHIRSEVSATNLPEADTHALFRIYAVLLLAKGAEVTTADVHNAWSAWMSERDPLHESLVPFDELPAEAVEQDKPYVEAVRSVARAMSE